MKTAYTLTVEQMASINDVELVFSTQRLLPDWEVIPDNFKQGNLYTKLASAIFNGDDLPDATIELKEGVVPEMLKRCVRAHLNSYSPDHMHKIAGVGYMIACASTISPVTHDGL